MLEKVETIFSFEKDWYEVNFVQKEDYDKIKEIEEELKEEWFEWDELEEVLSDSAWGSEAIVIEMEYEDNIPDNILKLAQEEYDKFNK